MITPHHPYTPMGFIDRFIVLAVKYTTFDVNLEFISDLYNENR